MSRWQCTRFPSGVAHIRTPDRRIVVFIDGEATVDDPTLDEGLRQVPEVFGLVELDAAPDQGDPEAVPDGTIDEVLAWVGEDADRADRAADAERARGDRVRKTLLEKLAEVAGGE